MIFILSFYIFMKISRGKGGGGAQGSLGLFIGHSSCGVPSRGHNPNWFGSWPMISEWNWRWLFSWVGPKCNLIYRWLQVDKSCVRDQRKNDSVFYCQAEAFALLSVWMASSRTLQICRCTCEFVHIAIWYLNIRGAVTKFPELWYCTVMLGHMTTLT